MVYFMLNYISNPDILSAFSIESELAPASLVF